MKRGAKCVHLSCDRDAVRSVHRRPYCECHAQVAERVRRNMEKNKPLLDRLAREGDCTACLGTEAGCERHRLAGDRRAEG